MTQEQPLRLIGDVPVEDHDRLLAADAVLTLTLTPTLTTHHSAFTLTPTLTPTLTRCSLPRRC